MRKLLGYHTLVGRIIRRTCSSNKVRNKDSFSSYSAEQQSCIIKTLQSCIINNVTRPYLNEKRIKSLKPLFDQNADIHSLEPLLNVNGIGPKLLQKICDSILESEYLKEPKQEQISENEVVKLTHSNLVTPAFNEQGNVDSIVSIHLGINTVSWSRLWSYGSSGVKVDKWDVMDLSEFVDKKYDIHSIWNLVLQFRNLVPDGDIYVMEGSNWSNVANIKKPMKYHIQEAMITTAICSIFNQTDFEGELREEVTNRLYFLRTFTSSRLFNKIVGSERVSAQDIVMNMIEGVSDQRYQPITFTDDTVEGYLALKGSLRDNMCRALLLAVSFAELVLHQNPVALSAIGKSARMKKKSS